MVQLSREHKQQGLAVISVSMDQKDDESKVLEFLKAKEASFDNVIIDVEPGSAEAQKYGLPQFPPFYQLYDRSGKLRYQFTPPVANVPDTEPLEKIDGRVLELLSES